MKLSSGGWKVIIFAAVFIGGVAVAYNMLQKEPTLPVFQPADINPRLVDKSLSGKKSDHHISDFNLNDQLGNTVTLKNLKGKIFVTDFFFTTCQSICPKMTTQLSRVAKTYKDEDDFMIVSHTVDPETDTKETLKEYARINQIDPKQWLLLTGDTKQIYNLARKSYFAVLDEPSPEGPDFVHTENFVLVDTKGQLRGFYDGTNPTEVDKLISDIAILLKED